MDDPSAGMPESLLLRTAVCAEEPDCAPDVAAALLTGASSLAHPTGRSGAPAAGGQAADCCDLLPR